MTRKLGRLLVVALVVAAIVAPATAASAIDLPVCGTIEYDPSNPAHILYPTDVGELKEFYSASDQYHGTVGLKYFFVNVDLRGMEGPLVLFADEGELLLHPWDVAIGVRILGTNEGDVLCGTSQLGMENVIKGLGGDDTINTVGSYFNVAIGGAGNDTIIGTSLGFDFARGGAGNDVIRGAGVTTGGPYPYAGDTGDDLRGGVGDDTLVGGDGMDLVHGQGGNDTMWGGGGIDKIVGQAGNDVIHGYAPTYYKVNDGGNILQGGAGSDEIWGAGGIDTIRGGGDSDTINAGAGNDWAVFGGTGDDTLTGVGDHQTLIGGPGSDTLTAYAYSAGSFLVGDDWTPYPVYSSLYNSEGADTLYGGSGTDVMFGGKGADNFYGSFGNDIMYGAYNIPPYPTCSRDSAADSFYGGWGDDMFFGGIGDLDRAIESLGEGNDTAINVDIILLGNVESSLNDGTCP
jgi:Ca2+-binding RTX toxin-like protein